MSPGYAWMRKVADELSEYAEHLEGSWSVEIGAAGPVMTMMRPVNRHERIAGRIRDQINQQITLTHPGWIAETGQEVEDPQVGRMRRPDVLVCKGSVPFGAWSIDTSAFRRYGKIGDA
ncbi:PDDEXK family nuclease [Streptomyces sp. DT9]